MKLKLGAKLFRQLAASPTCRFANHLEKKLNLLDLT